MFFRKQTRKSEEIRDQRRNSAGTLPNIDLCTCCRAELHDVLMKFRSTQIEICATELITLHECLGSQNMSDQKDAADPSEMTCSEKNLFENGTIDTAWKQEDKRTVLHLQREKH